MPGLCQTHCLGDTLHIAAAMAHRPWPQAFGIDRRYQLLFPTLPKGAQWDDRTWVRWQEPWNGPEHGVHVRDTIAQCVHAHGSLAFTLPRPPRQREADYALILPHSSTVCKEWEGWSELQACLPLSYRRCGSPKREANAPSLEAMASLIADAAFCIAIDSGPLHLATAYGVPVLGLYATTSSVTYGPYQQSTVVDCHREAWNRPVPYHSARFCSTAMPAITVDAVRHAIETFFPTLRL